MAFDDERQKVADPDVGGAEERAEDGPRPAAGTSQLAASASDAVDEPRDPPDDTFGSRLLPAGRGEAIPAEGGCSPHTDPGFTFDEDRPVAFACRMRSASATGPEEDPFPMVDGDRGRAVTSGGDLVLRCGTSDKLLFEAVIRCFEGRGVYVIAPGDLKLGAQRSDRRCEIAIGARDDAVTGAIACEDVPADPSNVFANTWTATGPGTFELPRTSR